MSLDETLGARFAELRRDAGLTQAALAERCEVSPETIGRLERGKQFPSLARLEQIAGVLGAELGDLLRTPRERTGLDVAIDRLTALLRRRGAEDAELVYAIAERVFERYPLP